MREIRASVDRGWPSANESMSLFLCLLYLICAIITLHNSRLVIKRPSVELLLLVLLQQFTYVFI